MADEECWAIRAQADALQAEVSTLRGAVAALRSARVMTTPESRAAAPQVTPWRNTSAAFVLGIAVTLAAVVLARIALCP